MLINCGVASVLMFSKSKIMHRWPAQSRKYWGKRDALGMLSDTLWFGLWSQIMKGGNNLLCHHLTPGITAI